MADRPILYSAPMIRALLAGTKTQTRRLCKWTPALMPDGKKISNEAILPGDRLWVRESLRADNNDQGVQWITYAADGSLPVIGHTLWGWKRDTLPSIHMPRWASRLTQIVTDVRVQRLQDISEEDAQAEAPPRCLTVGWSSAIGSPIRMPEPWKSAYRHLWDSINGPGSWDANPWVSAISLKTYHCNIDKMEQDK